MVEERPDSGETASAELASAVLAALGQLRRGIRASAGRPHAASARLTGSQIELMRLARRRPGLSVTDAATELAVAGNTISTLVGQLVQLRLLRRTQDPGDRRVARLELTPGALRRVQAWRDHRAEVVATALDDLDPADIQAISAALAPLARLAGRVAP